jgi:hypothetical protein
MRVFSRAAIAVAASLGFLFVGTAVAQEDPGASDPMLPYVTEEECVANGGVWTWDFCVDPDKVAPEDLYSGWDADGPAPAAPAPAAPAPAAPATVQSAPATQSQPQFTG